MRESEGTIERPVPDLPEDVFHRLVDSVQDYAIFMLDPTGRVQTWNEGARRLKGYQTSEILGKHFSIFYPDEGDRARLTAWELEVAEREGQFRAEGWRLRKDGSRFWADVLISPIHDDQGKLIGFSKVTRDLTERRTAQEALRRSEERLRLLIESVKDYAIFMLDPHGVVISWNAGAQRLKGYTPSEIIGQHFSVFYPEEERTAGKPGRDLAIAADTGRVEDEGWRIRKDGTRFWANIIITAVRTPEGQLLGFAKVTQDLTERLEAEQTRLRLSQADEAVRIRDEFLAIASHELRTPLTPLSMYLQSIERNLRNNRPVDTAVLVKARRQVRRLGRLIDDLLDLSRAQEGRLEMQQGDVELVGLATDVIEDFRATTEKHEIVLAAERPVHVRGDRARLEQVLVNLLHNAIKYSPEGGRIQVSVRSDEKEASVTVTDPGIGVPGDEQQQLFHRFFRAKNANIKNFGGMGVGLYLSNEIIRKHRGHFEVQSEPGKGSSFSFFLPTNDSGKAPLSERSVLLIDDDTSILDALSNVLRSEGYRVLTARNGFEALEVLHRQKADVVLVDLMLPMLDGAEFIERMRENKDWAAKPVIVFSADRQVDVKAARLHADGALRKPIDLGELSGTLQRVLSPRPPLPN